MEHFSDNREFDLYRDINTRTNGEIYIGVVGPVRTGKSTFIKRFMDLMVLPFMEDEHARERTIDELPQSAAGKTIMTTEPKFIPQEAVELKLAGEVTIRVRLVDCVGFMVTAGTFAVCTAGDCNTGICRTAEDKGTSDRLCRVYGGGSIRSYGRK